MAYINAEQTAKFRAQLKEAFPASKGWKLSVKTENYSTICVAIMEAPIDFVENNGKTEYDVNPYHFRNQYPAHFVEVFQKIYDICMKGNHNNSDSMSDYFDVGWYFSLSIGKWDRAFKYTGTKPEPAEKQEQAANEQPAFEKVEVVTGEVNIIEYSEKAIAVIGDTKPIKDKLATLGGRFNRNLSCGPGWIFPKTKLDTITKALAA